MCKSCHQLGHDLDAEICFDFDDATFVTRKITQPRFFVLILNGTFDDATFVTRKI
jgi:hypothetical protein